MGSEMCIRDRGGTCVVTVNVTASTAGTYNNTSGAVSSTEGGTGNTSCLLYTSDAADERSSVDLGGCRIINKKNSIEQDTSERSTKKNVM